MIFLISSVFYPLYFRMLYAVQALFIILCLLQILYQLVTKTVFPPYYHMLKHCTLGHHQLPSTWNYH